MASKIKLKTREKGAGSVYRDGKRWYLKNRINGKAKTTLLRNSDGSPCTKESDAISAADNYRTILLADSKEEIALHVAEAKGLKKRSGLLLRDAWDTYMGQANRPDSAPQTLKNHKIILNLFMTWLASNRPGIKRVAEVDKDTAEAYFSYLWSSGISAKRYNDEIMSLRLIFRLLAKTAALDSNPFSEIVKKTQEVVSRKEFSPEQIAAIFDGFDKGFFYETKVEKLGAGRVRERSTERLQYHPMNADEMRVLLNLCCWTGCRGQDGCLMQWKNVDLDKEIISYIPHKTARRTGGKAVTLPLHFNLKSALEDALKWRKSNKSGEDYILPNVAARYRHNPSGIQKDVMKIIRCATGLETTAKSTSGRRKLAANAYSLHSFRHSFVSFCSNSGVPLAIVAEIVGHGNPAMTRHYSHISTEAKQDAIAKLPMLNIPDKPVVEVTHPLDEADEETRILREKLLFSIRVSNLNSLRKIEEAIKPYIFVQPEFEF